MPIQFGSSINLSILVVEFVAEQYLVDCILLESSTIVYGLNLDMYKVFAVNPANGDGPDKGILEGILFTIDLLLFVVLS